MHSRVNPAVDPDCHQRYARSSIIKSIQGPLQSFQEKYCLVEGLVFRGAIRLNNYLKPPMLVTKDSSSLESLRW